MKFNFKIILEFNYKIIIIIIKIKRLKKYDDKNKENKIELNKVQYIIKLTIL
jgi:hypothetical protein